jgi:hypothetical protein
MKYAVEMGSGAMIYISSFIKTGSGIQKLIGGDTQTHRQHGEPRKLTFIFFKIKKLGYKQTRSLVSARTWDQFKYI